MYYFTGRAPTFEMDRKSGSSRKSWGTGGANGKMEFLVLWKDWDPSDKKWEPCSSFFPGYNEVLVEYCQKHGITLDLAQALAAPPKHTPKAKTATVALVE